MQYFLSQASGWAQWVWMLNDAKREEYRGSPDGVHLAAME